MKKTKVTEVDQGTFFKAVTQIVLDEEGKKWILQILNLQFPLKEIKNYLG